MDVAIDQIDRQDTRFQFRFCTRVDDLLESIRLHGQHTPVTLWDWRHQYVIIDGFRRIEALAKLGRTHVRAVVDAGANERDAALVSFSQNARRRNLSSYERAGAIWTASRRWGLEKPELATTFGLSARQIERYLALLNFKAPLREALEAGRISMAHAVQLHRMAKGDDLEWWLHEIARNGLSASELGAKLHRPTARIYLSRDDRGFRLRAMRFRRNLNLAERKRMATALEAALRIVAESIWTEERR